jgi:hypothetical protein
MPGEQQERVPINAVEDYSGVMPTQPNVTVHSAREKTRLVTRFGPDGVELQMSSRSRRFELVLCWLAAGVVACIAMGGGGYLVGGREVAGYLIIGTVCLCAVAALISSRQRGRRKHHH